jgi:uncharacterized glyoxalase superfamily protein PhnB
MPVVLDQINLVVADMDASIGFYRELGLAIADDDIWRTNSGAHHVVMKMPDGFELALDSTALAAVYNEGWRDPATSEGGSQVISFRYDTTDDVDSAFARLIATGITACQAPYYTFWGSRYAIVTDPDGNQIGLMGPPDSAHRSPPPPI